MKWAGPHLEPFGLVIIMVIIGHLTLIIIMEDQFLLRMTKLGVLNVMIMTDLSFFSRDGNFSGSLFFMKRKSILLLMSFYLILKRMIYMDI